MNCDSLRLSRLTLPAKVLVTLFKKSNGTMIASFRSANGEALPGYAVHNLSASLKDDAWTLTFYADNLLDKYAVTGVRADTAYLQTVPDINGDPVTTRRYFNNVLRPRTIGLRATYRFDL